MMNIGCIILLVLSVLIFRLTGMNVFTLKRGEKVLGKISVMLISYSITLTTAMFLSYQLSEEYFEPGLLIWILIGGVVCVNIAYSVMILFWCSSKKYSDEEQMKRMRILDL